MFRLPVQLPAANSESGLATEFEPVQALDVLLPAIFASHGEATLRVDAVFELVLAGSAERDEQVFSVDCTSYPAEVRRGRDEGSELTLVLAPHRLLSLLTGELDVDLARDCGELEVVGEPEILARLATLWSTPRGTDALSFMLERLREDLP